MKPNSESKDSKSIHQSVLLGEIIKGLSIKNGDTLLDATVNGGGHSKEIAARFGSSVKIVGVDADREALLRAEKTIPGKPVLIESNFRDVDKALIKSKISHVDRALFDLGLSLDQLEQSGRGFSFKKDEPLIMTLKTKPHEKDTTAHDVVNSWEEKNIAAIIQGFGEERLAKKIARAIVAYREKKSIESSRELAEIIEKAVPRRGAKIHPATKTFQAIRIAVNDELNALEEGLSKTWDLLSGGGRIAVISFHSLEDRIVKRFMRQKAASGKGKIINKKPITPSREEILKNPRARSAKLRIIEKNLEQNDKINRTSL